MRRARLAALALVLAVGCRSQSVPVRLQGDPFVVSSLAGTWNGEYWNGVGGRGGSLAFSLSSGSDSLYGDVMMVAATGQTMLPADPAEAHKAHVHTTQRLRIDFVAVRADSVRGTLEPYIAPECSCTVGTTFVGAVRGNVMTGIFETRHEGRVLATGKWEMHRVKPGR
jgi:hypothetical protein